MKKGVLTIVLIVSIIFSISCTNQSDKKSKNINKMEKAPGTLTKIIEEIDNLLASVDEIEKTIGLTEKEFQTQKSQKEDKKNTSEENNKENQHSKQDKSKEESQQKAGGEKSSITKDEDIFMKWREMDKKIEEIHNDWNSYEVESIKKGVNPEQGKEFKKNLYSLTKAVENRQIIDIEDTGSRAMNSLAPFFDLYKDEINGDLSRISYSIHQAFLKAREEDVKIADKLINEAVEHTGRIRQKLDKDKDKDKMKNLDKLSLAISDMKLALDENSMKLLEIKRNITLKNIKTLRE